MEYKHCQFVMFCSTKPGPDAIKLVTPVIYECSQKVKVFVLGRPLQAILMFVGKARSLPQSGTPERCFK
jgi:hypothetical protein